jgi:hypothetical protein
VRRISGHEESLTGRGPLALGDRGGVEALGRGDLSEGDHGSFEVSNHSMGHRCRLRSMPLHSGERGFGKPRVRWRAPAAAGRCGGSRDGDGDSISWYRRRLQPVTGDSGSWRRSAPHRGSAGQRRAFLGEAPQTGRLFGIFLGYLDEELFIVPRAWAVARGFLSGLRFTVRYIATL